MNIKKGWAACLKVIHTMFYMLNFLQDMVEGKAASRGDGGCFGAVGHGILSTPMTTINKLVHDKCGTWDQTMK